MVHRLNGDRDKQDHLVGHGYEQPALLVSWITSCRHWAREFSRSDFGYGELGENATATACPMVLAR